MTRTARQLLDDLRLVNARLAVTEQERLALLDKRLELERELLVASVPLPTLTREVRP